MDQEEANQALRAMVDAIQTFTNSCNVVADWMRQTDDRELVWLQYFLETDIKPQVLDMVAQIDRAVAQARHRPA